MLTFFINRRQFSPFLNLLSFGFFFLQKTTEYVKLRNLGTLLEQIKRRKVLAFN